MITLRKIDDVHLSFDGPKDELQMLSSYFTFLVPGYQFMPSYRNKYWDGKLRLADLKKNEILAGLFADITKFSKDMDVNVQFEGSKYDMPGREQPVEDSFLEGFLEVLNPHSKGQPIQMRDYQIEAFKSAVRKQRCLLLSPTASGKSLIIYSLIRWWMQTHERKILIVVPTIGLVSQMANDFSDYSNGKFTDVHQISAGVPKETNCRVVVSTWQSIHNQPYMWFAQFGSVIVDEVHHAQSKSIQAIMNKMIVCPDRVGLTGTLNEAKTHELVLKGLFGPIHKIITTKELMERGQIEDMKVRILQLKYPKESAKTVSKFNYNEEIEWLVTNEQRTKMIAKMAGDLPGNTLVVFNRIEHGKSIFEKLDTEKETYYVAGETGRDDRELVRHLAESNDCVIVASIGVFSTGINIRNLHNLIFAHPTKSKIKVLQSIGRILRKSDDGRPAIVFDLVDDLKHGQRENFALRHASERFKFYTNEKFDFKINKIDL